MIEAWLIETWLIEKVNRATRGHSITAFTANRKTRADRLFGRRHSILVMKMKDSCQPRAFRTVTVQSVTAVFTLLRPVPRMAQSLKVRSYVMHNVTSLSVSKNDAITQALEQ